MKNILKIKKFFLILTVLLLNLNSSYAIENKIIAKVNNEIITSIDIFNEINYLKMLNPKIHELANEKLFEISKNSLIREKVKKLIYSKL